MAQPPKTRILIADDDDGVRWVLQKAMQDAGHLVECASNGDEAIRLLAERSFDVALVDVRMPGRDGFAVLETAAAAGDDGPNVVLLTAADTVKNAIEAMKRGAFDYVAKPFDIEEIELVVARACANRRLEQEVKRLREAAPAPAEAPPEDLGLVGRSPQMREVFKTIGRVAGNDETVLVTGESGTGKELVARALHAHSGRSKGPFVAVNCAAIPAELMESELFGFVRGAFTGAFSDRAGHLEAASGGTLLLDEIGELSVPLQAKFLRVLQSREYTRLGSHKPLMFDARVIAATNRDLRQAVAEGSFRKDLYYRLHVVELYLPPLRERPQDIEPLARHFVTRACREGGVPLKEISPDTLRELAGRSWPGNARELENSLRRAVVMSHGSTLTPDDLESRGTAGPAESDLMNEPVEEILYRRLRPFVDRLVAAKSKDLRATAMAIMDRPLIRLALEKTGGNKLRAAELLGINRNTLHARMRELGIDPKKSEK
jgi:two-component system nitrogen regulation response regulator GlnG